MKAQELLAKTRSELEQELLGCRQEMFNLRMQKATDQRVRTHFFKLLRKDIARIKTVLRARELKGDLA